MKLLPVAALLLAASPAFAQSSHVYTNADLGHSSVTWTRSVTPEELAGLTDRQFVYIPPRPYGPLSVGVYSSPTAGPFGELILSPRTTRLDGTSLFDSPWMLTMYGGRSYGGVYGRSYGGGSSGRSAVRASGHSSARVGTSHGRR